MPSGPQMVVICRPLRDADFPHPKADRLRRCEPRIASRHVPAVRNDPNDRRRFTGMVAAGVGALSCVVIVALWLPPWWLSPCWA
jgi:hypothetical protein